jgi:hypothetical protein
MDIIRAKIDERKIDREAIYHGEKGDYIEITLLRNKDGKDRFGNDYLVVQDLGKDRRNAGEKGPILGNAKIVFQRLAERVEEQPASQQKSDFANGPF